MVYDHFNARSTLTTKAGKVTLYCLDALEKAGLTQLDRLPFSIRVLLESVLRQVNGHDPAERRDRPCHISAACEKKFLSQ